MSQSQLQSPRLLEQMRATLRARHYSLRTEGTYLGWVKRFILFHGKRHPRDLSGFLSPFGDMTLWNILVSCVVLPYIYPYSRMINRMLWGHILSVAPETSTMEGGARFHFDTSPNRPDPFVARCDHTAPRGV
jgi:integrase-like protein